MPIHDVAEPAALRVLSVGGAALGDGPAFRHARSAREAMASGAGFDADIVVLTWASEARDAEPLMRLLRQPERPVFIACLGGGAAALAAGANLALSPRFHPAERAALWSAAERFHARERAHAARLSGLLARLDASEARFQSLDADLIEAKKLQQSLLRERQIALGEVEISLVLRASGHVGGDLVGHFPISDAAMGFFALDVSGHGISSALMTARLAGYLSSIEPRQNLAIEMTEAGPKPRSPAATLSDLNMLVMEELETDHYFTMILGHVEAATGRVTFAQAGHPHPMVLQRAAPPRLLPIDGLPVGLLPGADYEDSRISLAPGERLVILSDGFAEAETEPGQMLGEAGLVELVRGTSTARAQDLLEALVWE
ncbi:MAG: SpoIIE family protein phosphatase, partial [Pseudomonadota bacterium]